MERRPMKFPRFDRLLSVIAYNKTRTGTGLWGRVRAIHEVETDIAETCRW